MENVSRVDLTRLYHKIRENAKLILATKNKFYIKVGNAVIVPITK